MPPKPNPVGKHPWLLALYNAFEKWYREQGKNFRDEHGEMIFPNKASYAEVLDIPVGRWGALCSGAEFVDPVYCAKLFFLYENNSH